ncbi:MAG: SPFH domain-containing protein [Coriobacteriales bacterium]|jgi:regulator of protease activity HflC (stomatin/prohibitin superfamily)|nr:SPFH domain-containing protein [Coriobacteriales bacterium]
MTQEKVVKVRSGWVMLFVCIASYVVSPVGMVIGGIFIESGRSGSGLIGGVLIALGSILMIVAILLSIGFFTLQPNQARVLVLFGTYKGTVLDEGFHWANPFYSRSKDPATLASYTDTQSKGPAIKKLAQQEAAQRSLKISLRARTYNSECLKVNDKQGNPIEISDVIVWRVADTAKAIFDVDDYNNYVHTQSETALRHVATTYAYDHAPGSDGSEITLRSNIEEVSDALKIELAQRLEKAGVAIDDARLTHLAYAPEIAQAMLRRQQAEAVIAAREKVVQGAVSMVDMALKDLSEKGVVELDDERKAAMVSNLLVVLCGETGAQPILNTGTLYN